MYRQVARERLDGAVPGSSPDPPEREEAERLPVPEVPTVAAACPFALPSGYAAVLRHSRAPVGHSGGGPPVPYPEREPGCGVRRMAPHRRKGDDEIGG